MDFPRVTPHGNHPPPHACCAMGNLRRTTGVKQDKERAVHPPQTGTDAQRLKHEIEVHQIELELQNQELQASQRETAAALERYTDLFDFAPVGYFNLSHGGIIHLVNLTGAKLVGVERSLLLNRRLGLLVSTDDRKAFCDFLGQVFATGTRQVCEVSLAGKDKPPLIVLLEATAAPDGKECRVAMTDITARKLLEEQVRQAQKMEAVGTLAGGIAHDFNNILGAIVGYTELSLMTLSENPQVRAHLGAVLKATRRATDLVRQILAFSRRQALSRKLIVLAPIVAECAALLRATIPTSIEFETSLAEDAPAVLADASQIHQILMNLGTNAWHAMKDRTGRLTIKLERCMVDEEQAARQPRLHAGVYARITVSDTGCGIDPATLLRIFEPFFTTKPVGEGTGLGLSVVHGMMDGHDGAVTVHSEPGQGTVFALYFPEKNGEPDTPAVAPDPVPHGHGEHILVVDDENVLVQINQMALTKLGYEVEVTTEPREALAWVGAEPERFDLVITDQTMPGMTGMELAVRLQLIREGLPVILTTGYISALTPAQLATTGILEILRKPATLQALAFALRSALSAKTNPRPWP